MSPAKRKPKGIPKGAGCPEPMSGQVKWLATKAEMKLIQKIVERAVVMDKALNKRSLAMHLDACHSNDTRLDFKKLLAADDFNFVHDVFGIVNKMDRQTGKLRDFFLPRCTLKKKVKA